MVRRLGTSSGPFHEGYVKSSSDRSTPFPKLPNRWWTVPPLVERVSSGRTRTTPRGVEPFVDQVYTSLSTPGPGVFRSCL